jgi:hypothetical protein
MYFSVPIYSASSPISKASVDTYFLRLWIQNEGRSRAEKVQVFIRRLLRETANGTFIPMDSFIPMNLRWGNAEVFADGISPGMGLHCNLARVADPANRKDIGDNHPDAKPNETILVLQTEMQPTNYCHILLPDNTYHIELLIAGANCRPTPYTIELTITGKWFEEREKMFQDGVMMRVVNKRSLDKGSFEKERLLRRVHAEG